MAKMISQHAAMQQKVMDAARWYADRPKEASEQAAIVLVGNQFGMTASMAYSAVFMARKLRAEDEARSRLVAGSSMRSVD